jgi:glucan phosphorylase
MLGKGTVYLLDVPEVTNVVYPGPEDAPKEHPNPYEWVENQKIKQSWLVGRGALALVKALNKKPDIIIQSETPTFFANHFLVMDSFQKDPFFEKTKYIFNDHTQLEDAHPVWNPAMIKKARVDPKYGEDKKFWNYNQTGIDVTRLLIGVSDATYGVAKKHGQVMRAMPSLKGLEDKIGSITNGVSVSDWPHVAYRNAQELSDSKLIELKEKKKSELLDWFWKRYFLWFN